MLVLVLNVEVLEELVLAAPALELELEDEVEDKLAAALDEVVVVLPPFPLLLADELEAAAALEEEELTMEELEMVEATEGRADEEEEEDWPGFQPQG